MRWRGRDLTYKEQVANACDGFVDLTPASEAPAQQVQDAWSALRAGQEIPLIGERVDGYDCQEDDGCPREC
jgi:hypothetical protein